MKATFDKGSFFRLFLRIQIVLLGLSVAAFAYTPQVQRLVKVINPDWKFIKQDVSGASAVSYSEGSMRSVNLPHSFDIPYWRANSPVGPYVGWYRKHITIPQAEIDAKMRFFIEFDGSYNATSLYVNGTYVGIHKGGFTGFSFDITKQVVAGDNVLAIRVMGARCDTIAPATGEFIFIGGIYRNVYLVKTNPLHVTWYGTFVSTPEVNTTTPSAKIKMKTEIKNDGTAAANCRVKTIVVDSSGNEVTNFESSQTVDAGATVDFVQTSSTISNVNLWSPSSPYMYTVYTEVYSGTTLVDNFKTPLGIRTIKWTMTNGFELNGKRLWLQGANVHQDHAGWAWAATDAGQYRDIKFLKDCGMNLARGSHYPHSPAFSDACDKLGVCLWSESVFWGFTNGGYADNASFRQTCLDETREMVRIHRNHPSVIMWSMGNEVWFASPQNLVVANVTAMIAVAHTEDSTRPAGIGGAQLWTNELGGPSDVVGMNGGSANYTYSKPMLTSEYGSCIDTSWVDKSGTNYCWNGEGDGSHITMSGNMPAQPAYCGGIALWCAFHHGSMADVYRDPFPGGGIYGYSGLMGMGTHARLPLQRWYVYRKLYLGTPLPTWPVNGTPAKLKLTADRTTITDDGTTDALLRVQVQDASGAWLLNSPSITFTDITGKGSFPDTSTDRSVSNVPTITFRNGPKVTDVLDKGVRNGEAGIEFRSYTAGTATIVASSGSLAKDSVTITVIHVPDPVPTHAIYFTPGLSQFTGPQEMILKSFGNRITLPKSMQGKKVIISLFDVQGKLIDQIKAVGIGRIDRPHTTQGIFVAKVRVVK
jgi:beta-galactosidase